MTMISKYPGKCCRCGKKINVGEKIEWDKKAGASHVDCAAKGEAIPDNAIRISGGSGYGCHGWTAGEIVRNPYHGNDHRNVDDSWQIPEYLYVITAKSTYYREDGMSFGIGDESGYFYSAQCRAATDDESKPLRDEEQKRLNKKTAFAKLREIADMVQKSGERPEGVNIAEGDEVAVDVSSRLYGGGDWFVIGKEHLWYVRNNGADGSDWSANNVRTGGAGAIGWRIPYHHETAQLIRLAKQCSISGEDFNTATLEPPKVEPGLLCRSDAEKVLKKAFALRCDGNDYLLTDLDRCYIATTKNAFDYDNSKFHPDSAHAQNQSWLVYYSDEKPIYPEWFNVNMVKKLTEKCDWVCWGDLKKELGTGRIGRYANSEWYARCEQDAIWLSHIHWTVLDRVLVTPDVKLEYDNGQYEHPIQLWSDGCLSMIQSFAKFGAIDASVSLLLQHAVSSKDSKWRKNKKWQELLYYTGEIGSFVKVAGKEETGYSEETTAARAGKYILVRTDWGAWGGGDADGGSFLYLLDDKDAEYAKHNSKLAAS